MQLSHEQEQKVLEMAAKDLADRVWVKIESQVEEIQLFSVNRAAGMMDLTPSQVRKIAEDIVDFGERCLRLSIAQIKRPIAARTVKRKV